MRSTALPATTKREVAQQRCSGQARDMRVRVPVCVRSVGRFPGPHAPPWPQDTEEAPARHSGPWRGLCGGRGGAEGARPDVSDASRAPPISRQAPRGGLKGEGGSGASKMAAEADSWGRSRPPPPPRAGLVTASRPPARAQLPSPSLPADADSFEAPEPGTTAKAAAADPVSGHLLPTPGRVDRWAGEDEDDDVKVRRGEAAPPPPSRPRPRARVAARPALGVGVGGRSVRGSPPLSCGLGPPSSPGVLARAPSRFPKARMRRGRAAVWHVLGLPPPSAGTG